MMLRLRGVVMARVSSVPRNGRSVSSKRITVAKPTSARAAAVAAGAAGQVKTRAAVAAGPEMPESLKVLVSLAKTQKGYLNANQSKRFKELAEEVERDFRALFRDVSAEAAEGSMAVGRLSDGTAKMPSKEEPPEVALVAKPDEALGLVGASADGWFVCVDPSGSLVCVPGSQLVSFEPDTQDRLLEEAKLSPAEYCKKRGISCTAAEMNERMRVDLLKRSFRMSEGKTGVVESAESTS